MCIFELEKNMFYFSHLTSTENIKICPPSRQQYVKIILSSSKTTNKTFQRIQRYLQNNIQWDDCYWLHYFSSAEISHSKTWTLSLSVLEIRDYFAMTKPVTIASSGVIESDELDDDDDIMVEYDFKRKYKN